MALISQIFDVEHRKGTLFGVEVECEGENLAIPEGAIWRTEKDGSLRGEFPHQKAEYVFPAPKDFTYSMKAIDHLINLHKAAGSIHKFSYRTSTHVHLNVSDMEESKVQTIAYTYYLFETLFSRFCGEHRMANRFCLRYVDSGGVASMFEKAITHGFRDAGVQAQDACRYAGLNLASLPKYGTLEFRMMRGTLDRETLRIWLSVIHHLRDWGEKNSIRSTYKLFQQKGAKALMLEVFGKDLAKILWDSKAEQDVNTCASYTLTIPFIAGA